MEFLRSLVAASLAAGLAAAAQPAFGQAAATPRFTSLPGRAVGVLVSNIANELVFEGRQGPPDALGFARGSSSYRWAYVPCHESAAEPLVVLTGRKGDKRQRFDSVCLLTEAVAAKQDIPAEFALVEVEINDGLGCPGVDSFVATSLRVLDGTVEYPIQVIAAVKQANDRFERHCEEQQRAVDLEFRRLSDQALHGREVSGKLEESNVHFITWLSRSKKLRIDLRRRVTDGAYDYASGTTPQNGQATTDMRYGTQVSAELRSIYTFLSNGRLDHVESMPVTGFVTALPPPK